MSQPYYETHRHHKKKKTKKHKTHKRHTRDGHLYTLHHVIPQSRLKEGQAPVVVELPGTVHAAWHILFDNLYGKEIIEFIKRFQELMRRKNIITEVELIQLWQEIKSENLNSLKGNGRKEVYHEETRRFALYPMDRSASVSPMR